MGGLLVYFFVVLSLVCTVLLGTLPKPRKNARFQLFTRRNFAWAGAGVAAVFIAFDTQQSSNQVARLIRSTSTWSQWNQVVQQHRRTMEGQWRTLQADVAKLSTMAPPRGAPREKLLSSADNISQVYSAVALIAQTHGVSIIRMDAPGSPKPLGEGVVKLQNEITQRQASLRDPSVVADPDVLAKAVGEEFISIMDVCRRGERIILDDLDMFIQSERKRYEKDPENWTAKVPPDVLEKL